MEQRWLWVELLLLLLHREWYELRPSKTSITRWPDCICHLLRYSFLQLSAWQTWNVLLFPTTLMTTAGEYR